jgi:hypothetical protein
MPKLPLSPAAKKCHHQRKNVIETDEMSQTKCPKQTKCPRQEKIALLLNNVYFQREMILSRGKYVNLHSKVTIANGREKRIP